jgi:hypothetical protein
MKNESTVPFVAVTLSLEVDIQNLNVSAKQLTMPTFKRAEPVVSRARPLEMICEEEKQVRLQELKQRTCRGSFLCNALEAGIFHCKSRTNS